MFNQGPFSVMPLSDFEKADVKGRIYRISHSEAPWGDYGRILFQGIANYRSNIADELRLERTGPFVPPITFPGIWEIVVTSEMMKAMEESGFKGIGFRKVVKTRITKVDWHKWDMNADDPKGYPSQGEPKNYILARKHNEKISVEMGDIWEVVVLNGVVFKHIDSSKIVLKFDNVPTSWSGSDIFSINGQRRYTSQRAKDWFQRYFPEWTNFEEVITKDDV